MEVSLFMKLEEFLVTIERGEPTTKKHNINLPTPTKMHRILPFPVTVNWLVIILFSGIRRIIEVEFNPETTSCSKRDNMTHRNSPCVRTSETTKVRGSDPECGRRTCGPYEGCSYPVTDPLVLWMSFPSPCPWDCSRGLCDGILSYFISPVCIQSYKIMSYLFYVPIYGILLPLNTDQAYDYRWCVTIVSQTLEGYPGAFSGDGWKTYLLQSTEKMYSVFCLVYISRNLYLFLCSFHCSFETSS